MVACARCSTAAVAALIVATVYCAAPASAAPNPCTDPRGAALALKAANPTLDNLTLAEALIQGQELYGCRAPAPAPTPSPSYVPDQENVWVTTPRGVKQCVFVRGQLAGCY